MVTYLRPKSNAIWCDGTVGAGGHVAALLNSVAETRAKAWVIGLDRDAEMLKLARQKLHDFHFHGHQINLVQANYSNLAGALAQVGIKPHQLDFILLDLGLSRIHFKNSERGFSFSLEGPLDMRMNRQDITTALEFLQESSEQQLKEVLSDFGEESWAGPIAKAIKMEINKNSLHTTKDLAELVRRTIPKKHHPKIIDPATKTFQAIRMKVNDEIHHLEVFLKEFPHWIKKGGRLGMITFHSLEDRLVKRAFQTYSKGCICPPDFPVCRCGKKPILRLINRKPLRPTPKEIFQNPPSRSAKFRVVEMIA